MQPYEKGTTKTPAECHAIPSLATAGGTTSADPSAVENIPPTPAPEFERYVIARIVWCLIFASAVPALVVFGIAINEWHIGPGGLAELGFQRSVIDSMSYLQSEFVSISAGLGVLFIYGVFFEQMQPRSDGNTRSTLTALTLDGRRTVWLLLVVISLTLIASAFIDINKKNWDILAEHVSITETISVNKNNNGEENTTNASGSSAPKDHYPYLEKINSLTKSSVTFCSSILFILIGLRPRRTD